MTCDRCNTPIEIGDWPFCPHGRGAGMINADDIPGGVLIKHGLCWPNGTPRRFDSYSEIRKAAFEAGLTHGGDTPKVNHKATDAAAEAKYRQELARKRG